MSQPTQGELAAELRERYPALEGLDETSLAGVLERSSVVRLPAGTLVFGEGSPRAIEAR